jgi:hypothetical protein
MRKVYPKIDNRKLDALGREIMVPSYFVNVDDLLSQQASVKLLASQGDISIFDAKIVEEIKLSGGEVWVTEATSPNVGSDDFVEFSLIDKDDILGYFSMLGLTVGVDILEVSKFVFNEYIQRGPSPYHLDLVTNIPGAAFLMQGLYRRIVYHSVNSTGPVEFISKLFYYVRK